jgi:molybdopterin/thiamine biosynthesis adenylyltransferase
MTDDQLLRYSRHILLDEIGVEGQRKLLASHALVVGAGGLGSPVALYLGSAGVGHITLVDDDVVDLTNLQRQIAHSVARVGQPKVESAAQAIAAINPDVRVTCIQARADAARLHSLVADADVVLDCCDNFATRQAVNAACMAHGKPLVSGAAVRFDGQLAVFDPPRQRVTVLRLRISARVAPRRNALRHPGRVCTRGRHHRQPAGRRSPEADLRRRPHGNGPPAHAGRADLAVHRDGPPARSGLPGLRPALSPPRAA